MFLCRESVPRSGWWLLLRGDARVRHKAGRKHHCVDVLVMLPGWCCLGRRVEPATHDLIPDVGVIVDRLHAPEQTLGIVDRPEPGVRMDHNRLGALYRMQTDRETKFAKCQPTARRPIGVARRRTRIETACGIHKGSLKRVARFALAIRNETNERCRRLQQTANPERVRCCP